MEPGADLKYLVMILESGYNYYNTFQEIEKAICHVGNVHSYLVGQADDLVGVTDIYLVDSRGIRRWDL